MQIQVCCVLTSMPLEMRYADHCVRVSTFLENPEAIPLYEANHVDTAESSILACRVVPASKKLRLGALLSLALRKTRDAQVQEKLWRAGGFAVEGARRAAPLLSLPWALGVRAVDPLQQQ